MNSEFQNKIGLIIGLFLLLVSCNLQAVISRPVTEDGKPTEVQVMGAILDVDKIDSTEQDFTLNLYIAYRWIDHRLKHDGQGSIKRDISEIWNPELVIINTQKHWDDSKSKVEISPDGEVTCRVHLFGSFSQPMDLHDFPHDRHVFEVPMVATGFSSNEVSLIPYQGMDAFVAEKLSVADWEISNMQGKSREVMLSNQLTLPGFVFSFEGKRMVNNFVIKMIIPLSLIVMMSWVVFWVDPELASNRLGVAVTSVLTLIAYHIALSGNMPKTPYLTDMDKFLFSSTVLVFMVLIEIVIASHLFSNNLQARARNIDRISRRLFPVLFLGALVYSFFI